MASLDSVPETPTSVDFSDADAALLALRVAALPIAAVAVLNSVVLMIHHARYNRHAALRVYTVRILLMVVIDSIAAVSALWGTGWISKWDPIVEKVMHFIVELYESVVIFSFLQFVLVCGAGPDRLAAQFVTRDSPRELADSTACSEDCLEGGSTTDGESLSSSSLTDKERGDGEKAAPDTDTVLSALAALSLDPSMKSAVGSPAAGFESGIDRHHSLNLAKALEEVYLPPQTPPSMHSLSLSPCSFPLDPPSSSSSSSSPAQRPQAGQEAGCCIPESSPASSSNGQGPRTGSTRATGLGDRGPDRDWDRDQGRDGLLRASDVDLGLDGDVDLDIGVDLDTEVANAAARLEAKEVRQQLAAAAAAAAGRAAAQLPATAVAGKREPKHLPMLGLCFPPWRSGRQMLTWCVSATLAYVVVGVILAFVGIILLVVPAHGRVRSAIWMVSCIVLSASQALAIMGLATLAVNVREEISLVRPYGKFLSVKFVVFFAFWQGMLLNLLGKFNAFSAFEDSCGTTAAKTIIQNFLICLEMLAASIGHYYVFPPHDYLKLLAQHRIRHGECNEGCLEPPPTIAEVVDMRDIFSTARQVHRVKPHSDQGSPETSTSEAKDRIVEVLESEIELGVRGE